jgi:hypothetical protein
VSVSVSVYNVTATDMDVAVKRATQAARLLNSPVHETSSELNSLVLN